MGNLGCGRPGEESEGERDLSFERQRREAAGEEQLKPLVGELRGPGRLWSDRAIGFDLKFGEAGRVRPIATDPINSLPAGGDEQDLTKSTPTPGFLYAAVSSAAILRHPLSGDASIEPPI